jgi:hypothetical protein
MYKSLTAQSLHSFARPHVSIRRDPIDGAAAWRADIAASSAWRAQLSVDEQHELDTALDTCNRSGQAADRARRERLSSSHARERAATARSVLGLVTVLLRYKLAHRLRAARA